MARNTGLGRGLGALLDENAFDDEGLTDKIIDDDAIALSGIAGKILEIPIGEIDTHQDQPRKNFDEDKLNELAHSIDIHGIVQPIIVRQSGDRYTIIAGERRYRAARIAQLEVIPSIVKEVDSKEQLEISIIENLQREDLNPLEEAAAIKLLMTQYELNQEKAAERVGKSRSAVANSLRLLQLPERVRLMLFEGKITSGHAKCLGGLESDEDKVLVAQKVSEEGMSVREIEKLVQKLNKNNKDPKLVEAQPKEKNFEVIDVESKLSNALDTKVKLSGNFDKGKIMIEYYSQEQLDAIFSQLTNHIN